MAGLTLSGASASMAGPAVAYTLQLSGASATAAAPPTVMPAYWTRVGGVWAPMVRFRGGDLIRPDVTPAYPSDTYYPSETAYATS